MPARRVFKSTLAFALGSVAAMPVCSFAESLNAKTGAWEITTTIKTTGSLIPADKLAQMPPQQRAAIEKALKEQTKPTVKKSCVTKADLDQDRLLKSNGDARCTRNVTSKSETKLVVDQTCPAPHASTSHLTVEAATPESIVASMDMVQADANNAKVHADIVGRWLGESCAGIKGEN